MLKHVLPVMGAEDWIVRYEVQARGTIHAHLLLRMKGGPSHQDMKNAYQDISKVLEEKKEEIRTAQEKIVHHSTTVLGISALHPNPDPKEWPAPYGQNVYTPPTNCLRQRFLDIQNDDEMKRRHELLVNRTMCHQCRIAYCLCKEKLGENGQMKCRFGFPIDLHGFQEFFF